MAQVADEIWTGHFDGSIAVWSVDNGELLKQYSSSHNGPIKAILTQFDEHQQEASELKQIWTGSKDGVLVIWQPASSIADRIESGSSERPVLVQGHLRSIEQVSGVGGGNTKRQSRKRPKMMHSLRLGDYCFDKVVLVGASVREVDIVNGDEFAGDGKSSCVFAVHSSVGSEFMYECATEAECAQWVAGLTRAIAHFIRENNVCLSSFKRLTLCDAAVVQIDSRLRVTDGCERWVLCGAGIDIGHQEHEWRRHHEYGQCQQAGVDWNHGSNASGVQHKGIVDACIIHREALTMSLTLFEDVSMFDQGQLCRLLVEQSGHHSFNATHVPACFIGSRSWNAQHQCTNNTVNNNNTSKDRSCAGHHTSTGCIERPRANHLAFDCTLWLCVWRNRFRLVAARCSGTCCDAAAPVWWRV
jgi:hypothetical protein